MRIVPFRHEGVKEDGTFENPEKGSVTTAATFRFLEEESQFICIGCPRTKDGVVEGVTIYFDSRKELSDYLSMVGEKTFQFSETYKIANKEW